MKHKINAGLITVCFLVGMMYGFNGQAGIYQCTQENGHVEFRDTPCSTGLPLQRLYLPSTLKTDAKIIKAEENELKRVAKQQEHTQRNHQRQHLKAKKNQTEKIEKEERRLQRCARLQEKIDTLENQLKQGHKLKRYKRLQAQLEHAELMKERYCKAS